MSIPKNTVTVTLLGKRFVIKCPTDDSQKVIDLQTSALLVDKKMREVRDKSKMVGMEKIAIITALNLAYELLTEQQKTAEPGKMADQLRALCQKLTQALDSTSTYG